MHLPLSDGFEVPRTLRDSVAGIAADARTPPAIVSVSDVHGYLERARSALLTPRDSPTFDPVVVADGDGTLHWAGVDYVLVFNGDLVDRGPANDEVLAMVARLVREAPPGRVRVTLGNHEAIALSPDHFGFSNWYSGRVAPRERRRFLRLIVAGHVVAAYGGYNVTYAHAGSPEPYETSTVNAALVEAATDLLDAAGTPDDGAAQRRVLDDYPRVLGVGDGHPKGPGAGLVWLDFDHLPADAPPQVVGHTRHGRPRTKGNVFCQNVIRENLDGDGGEAAFVETPASLSALVRRPDGGTDRIDLARFDR